MWDRSGQIWELVSFEGASKNRRFIFTGPGVATHDSLGKEFINHPIAETETNGRIRVGDKFREDPLRPLENEAFFRRVV